MEGCTHHLGCQSEPEAASSVSTTWQGAGFPAGRKEVSSCSVLLCQEPHQEAAYGSVAMDLLSRNEMVMGRQSGASHSNHQRMPHPQGGRQKIFPICLFSNEALSGMGTPRPHPGALTLASGDHSSALQTQPPTSGCSLLPAEDPWQPRPHPCARRGWFPAQTEPSWTTVVP